MARIHVPIRLKIIIGQLFIVTAVVFVITFTMADLFHDDKTTYIHDLTSVITMHVAEEADSILRGHNEKLRVFARLMAERGLTQEQKAAMMKKLFEEFTEFIMIARYDEQGEKVTVYDSEALREAGLAKEDYSRDALPLDLIYEGRPFIENSTLSAKLPTFTMAVAETQRKEGARPAVVSAVVRLDSLLKLAGRSRVFETFLIDNSGSYLAHTNTGKVISRHKESGLPTLQEFRGGQNIGTTHEYSYTGVQMVGGLARVEFGGLVAGVQIPKSTAYLTAKVLFSSLMGVSFALLIASVLLSLFWSRRLTRPLEKLSDATKELGRGEFNIHIERTSNDEIGHLAESFNQMASELSIREKALNEAQAQLVQSEKMAAFGQLGAGIAHEVKNPLAGILGFAQLSLRKTEKDSPLHKNLLQIEKETRRCKTIIENLLKFARQEKVQYAATDINRVVQDSIDIMGHQLGIHQIKVEKDLSANLPEIMANGNQIQQVLMNFMLNSQQAMNGNPGTVRLETAIADAQNIEIRVKDNGPGIPKEIQTKIFEPFFTTKPAGQGTGLGLSVSYGIIKDHGGIIRIVSQQGEGTLFIITLPVNRKVDDVPHMKENDMQEITDTRTETSGEPNEE